MNLSLDWGIVYRTGSKLCAIAGMSYIAYLFYQQCRLDPVGAMGSLDPLAMAVFFALLTFASGERYQGFNLLFLSGLYLVAVTF